MYGTHCGVEQNRIQVGSCKFQRYMNTEGKIIQIIYEVIDETNARLPPERHLEKSGETVLFGKQGQLDSIGLVHFIVAVEDRLREDLGISITVADDHAMSATTSPFRSVSSLTRHIRQLIVTDV
jgi:acyl carrier protein